MFLLIVFFIVLALPVHSTDIELSDEQICLLANLYFEAHNEPIIGKIAVAQVVKNRKVCSYYSNSICGVINRGSGKEGCAFSWLCDEKTNDIYLLTKESIINWNEDIQVALMMTSEFPLLIDEIRLATLYHSKDIKPWWANESSVHYITTIGNHLFYSEDGVCD